MTRPGSKLPAKRRLTASIALALFGTLSASAQVYSVTVRPPGLSYRVARTEHFELIYQSGYEREAARTGMILEAALPRARELTGTSRRIRVPVVLNAYDDRSNGFVTSFPFKMEIEIPSLKGNRLSPRHPSWLHAVGRHELVHALHAEYGSGFGLVGLVRWFSPDLSRSFNLMLPPGIAEGIAVYLESEGPARPGRLNHSLFSMEYRAAMAADRQWSLAQMLEPPAYSIPGDRFYHGGAHLYAYMYDRDRGHAFRRAQRSHYRFPFLGYGVSLWAGTGKAPWVLGREFRLQARQQELERQLRLGRISEPAVIASEKGLVHRRPQWLSNTEVVAYVSGYHTVPGFYRIEVPSGRRSRISADRITEDAMFTLSPRRRSLVFSRYVASPTIESRRVAEVFEIDIERRRSKKLTRTGRAFTPAKSAGGAIWGTIDAGPYSRLVKVGMQLDFVPVALPPRTTVKALSWSPAGDTLAAIINDNGAQGLYLIVSDGERWHARPLMVPPSGSVLDFSWLPNGGGLLFTFDVSDVPNLYVLTFEDGTIRRLTNARYGAFEGSVSPDGSQIAFVDYQHERWNLVTMKYDPHGGEIWNGSGRNDGEIWNGSGRNRGEIWNGSGRSPEAVVSEPPVSATDSFQTLDSRPYRPIRYLAPREIFPLFDLSAVDTGAEEDVDLGIAVGAAVAAADPLQKWSYVAAGWYQANEFWGRLTVRTATSRLQPTLSAFRTPSTRIVNTALGIRRVGREEEGVTLGSFLPVTLSNNVYGTSFAIGVASQYSRARLFDKEGNGLTRWEQRATIAPTALAEVATHSNRRDIRFRRGLVVGGTLLHDVWGTSDRRTGVLVDSKLFLPSVPGSGGSFSLNVAYLWQSEAAIYDLDRFVPRGLENTFIPKGGHVKYGLDVVQPIAFVDDGLFVLPIYLQSIYVFAFAESVRSASELSFGIDSAGGGVGLQLRLLHVLNIDLRIGTAYLPDLEKFETIFR